MSHGQSSSSQETDTRLCVRRLTRAHVETLRVHLLQALAASAAVAQARGLL